MRTCALICLLCLASGCAEAHSHEHEDARAPEDRAPFIGTKNRYAADVERVARAARAAIADAGLTLTDDSARGSDVRVLRAEGPAEGGQPWRKVMINCAGLGAGETMVHVMAYRTVPRRDAEQTALTNDLFARIERNLKGAAGR